MKIFNKKKINIFLIFAQNIDCGYTLEPPHRGGSNEYPQSMFWSKNKKKGIPLHTPLLLYKSGVQGVFIARTCFPNELIPFKAFNQVICILIELCIHVYIINL